MPMEVGWRQQDAVISSAVCVHCSRKQLSGALGPAWRIAFPAVPSLTFPGCFGNRRTHGLLGMQGACDTGGLISLIFSFTRPY